MEPEKKINFSLIDILFPFLIPLKGTVWLGEKIRKAAEAEFLDKSRVKEELLKLQMSFEMGEIHEEEFENKEAKLLEKLEAIRKYEEEKKD